MTAEGCEETLNNYCNQGDHCRICNDNKKYARLDFAAHMGANLENALKGKQWRCYCDYTLTEDLQKWNDDAKNKHRTDYCSRHAQIEKRLRLCKEKMITNCG